MKTMKYGLILLISVMLWGCGKGNPAAPVTVENTKKHHPANWALGSNHGANVGLGAKASASTGGGMNNCRSCHGADFSGGISKVSCFNNAACHGTGVVAAHMVVNHRWSGPSGSVAGSHKSADPGNASACYICHAGGNNSALKPTAPPAAGEKPGCFNNTLCHKEGAHTIPFPGASHAPGGSFLAGAPPFDACRGCHNATITGSNVYGFRPDCAACHIDIAHLVSNPGCGDCHGVKVGTQDGRPTGAAFPDRQFSHGVHTFAGVGCSACHSGYGSGSQDHGLSQYNPAPKAAVVVISPAYQAETVSPGGSTAAYNPATGRCTNISCHGGAAPNSANLTPDWKGGAANLTADCFNCHDKATNAIPALPAAYAPTTITPQYNSFWSGDGRGRGHIFGNSYHTLHLGMGNGAELDFRAFGLITCVDCHDTALLAPIHFAGLNSSAMSGGAANTIKASFGYTAGNGWTCDTGGCHTTGERTDFSANPKPWK